MNAWICTYKKNKQKQQAGPEKLIFFTNVMRGFQVQAGQNNLALYNFYNIIKLILQVFLGTELNSTLLRRIFLIFRVKVAVSRDFLAFFIS